MNQAMEISSRIAPSSAVPGGGDIASTTSSPKISMLRVSAAHAAGSRNRKPGDMLVGLGGG